MRVRSSLGYTEVPGVSHAQKADAYGSPLPIPTMTPSVLPGQTSTYATTASRWSLTPSPAVPESAFSQQQYSLGPRWRPTPAPGPRDAVPLPFATPGVVRTWNVTPAIPEGTFRPTLPQGAQVPEVFTAPDGRRWFAPRPRLLPGELLWLRLLNALRGGAASTPSASAGGATAPSSALLPAYDLFQPGIFGPGEATTEDPALSKVKADESRGFPFLPVLLLGGGAFLAYRVVRGKKGAQTVKAA